MNTHTIQMPSVLFLKNLLVGKDMIKSSRVIKDLSGIFADKKALDLISPDTPVYDVYSYLPVAEGTPGGLYFGITHIYPGKVGSEYYMTKGHFHLASDRSEFYWGLEGEGMLILMDRERNTWCEKMFPGSLHFIPGNVAHRVANTGNSMLSFAACWPSDAGHNYEEIAQNGFNGKLSEINGVPQLI